MAGLDESAIIRWQAQEALQPYDVMRDRLTVSPSPLMIWPRNVVSRRRRGHFPWGGGKDHLAMAHLT